jgi:hypothetical protein
LTGQECDEIGVCGAGPAELRELNYRQAGAYFRGLEGKLGYDIWHTSHGVLKIDAMGDYVRASLSGGGNVPRIPPYRFGGGMTWKVTNWMPASRCCRWANRTSPGSLTPDSRLRFSRCAGRLASGGQQSQFRAGADRPQPWGRSGAQCRLLQQGPGDKSGRSIRLVARLATD